ncbi:hypothetical protein CRG98_031276 [Punica granatum]|uniref:Calmodulin binding protein-like N-terminal domain-containing protein n=1 Tax=Punica granatum TaxID=22663 RepID=A0A2I0IWF4_PUNGR|nr:hypothetical protein CRG98_031276 [Punica granatum]
MASAAKRPALSGSFSGSGHGLDYHTPPPTEKRLRPTTRFVSDVFEAWKQNQLEKLCSAMEPVIRKVFDFLYEDHQVGEEVKRRLDLSTITASRHLSWSPSLQVHARAPEPPSVNIPLLLVFPKTLKQPIFTMNRIISHDDSPVQVLLANPTVDQTVNTTAIPLSALPFPVKLEILVLDGDFPDGDGMWTAEEFENSIVKAREGRRPLLVGDLAVTLRPGDGSCGDLAVISFGELQLTDNSSWVRSRKFRLGVRVIPGSYGGTIRIREAVTEAFLVRDHRGEYLCSDIFL